MTVKEMAMMTAGDATIALFDKESNTMVYNEYIDCNEKGWDRFRDCEVLGVGAYKENEVAIYINAPSRHFETFLDVTYSLKINVDVPYGEDENKFIGAYGDKILDSLPKTITINDAKWEYGWDNMDSGSFYDCIEER